MLDGELNDGDRINSKHEEGADAEGAQEEGWRFSHLETAGLSKQSGGSTSRAQKELWMKRI